MKYCNHCKINVDTDESFCPICYDYIEGEDTEKDGFTYYLPREKQSKYSMRSNNFVAKLFVYLSICAAVICCTVNYFTDKRFLWAPVVMFSILYLWILIAHTIMSDRNPFEKILLQFVGILLLLWSLENLSLVEFLFSYVMPSIIIVATTVLAMVSMISRNRANFLVSFFTFYIVFIVISLVFLIFFRQFFPLLYLIALIYNFLVLAGTLLFGFKILKTEIAKKAHL